MSSWCFARSAGSSNYVLTRISRSRYKIRKISSNVSGTKRTKAVQVQSRIKQLEKIERIWDEEDNSSLRLKFVCSSRSGNYPVICEDMEKSYGGHVVFHDVNLTINRGEKVAFVGKNGEGKSTLVKRIMGEIPHYTGKLTLGHNVQIGYFAQNQAQLLDESLTGFAYD